MAGIEFELCGQIQSEIEPETIKMAFLLELCANSLKYLHISVKRKPHFDRGRNGTKKNKKIFRLGRDNMRYS